MKRDHVLTLLLVVSAAVFLAWRHYGRSDTLSISEATAFPITAEQLYHSYNENEVAADRQYKENVLAVTGTVGEIGKDILNGPYVILQVGGGGAVQCSFGKEEEEDLALLKPGQQVTIKGRCSGRTLGVIGVKECLLQATPTPPTSSIQPQALILAKPEGSEAILHLDGVKKIPMAVSTDDFYKVKDAIDDGDDAKALAMIQQGKVVMVENDSPVVVIEPFGYLTKIKLKGSGRVGWVMSACLR